MQQSHASGKLTKAVASATVSGRILTATYDFTYEKSGLCSESYPSSHLVSQPENKRCY